MKRIGTHKTIGLLGAVGSGNLGDAAWMDAVIQNLRELLPAVEIVAFSCNPHDTETRHSVRSYSLYRTYDPILRKPETQKHELDKSSPLPRPSIFRRMTPLVVAVKAVRRLGSLVIGVLAEVPFLVKSYRHLRELDVLAITGGGQLSDLWGGPWAHPFTLLKWICLARLARRRCVFLSVGVDPIKSSLTRYFLRIALTLAQYRSYRDVYSKSVVDSLGINQNDPVVPDMAYSLTIDRLPKRMNSGRRLSVGISPMSYRDPRSWPDGDPAFFHAYVRKLATIVYRLAAEGHVVNLLHSDIRMDIPVVKDIQNVLVGMHSVDSAAHVFEPEIFSVDQLMHHIAEADILIATRFHGVLLPTVLAKPVIAISSSKKVDTLMESLGLWRYRLDIHDLEVDVVLERFNELSTNRVAISRELSVAASKYKAAVKDQYRKVLCHE